MWIPLQAGRAGCRVSHGLALPAPPVQYAAGLSPEDAWRWRPDSGRAATPMHMQAREGASRPWMQCPMECTLPCVSGRLARVQQSGGWSEHAGRLWGCLLHPGMPGTPGCLHASHGACLPDIALDVMPKGLRTVATRQACLNTPGAALEINVNIYNLSELLHTCTSTCCTCPLVWEVMTKAFCSSLELFSLTAWLSAPSAPCAASCGAAGREEPCLRPVQNADLARQGAVSAPEALHNHAAQRSERGSRSAVLQSERFGCWIGCLVVLEAVVTCARPLICIIVGTAALHRGHVLVQECSLACKIRISYLLLARLLASRRSTRFGDFQQSAQLTPW